MQQALDGNTRPGDEPPKALSATTPTPPTPPASGAPAGTVAETETETDTETETGVDVDPGDAKAASAPTQEEGQAQEAPAAASSPVPPSAEPPQAEPEPKPEPKPESKPEPEPEPESQPEPEPESQPQAQAARAVRAQTTQTSVTPSASPIFVSSIIYETVRLDAVELTNRFRDTILEKLRIRLEGKCSRHGYIKANSVEVMRVAPGMVRAFSLNGDAIFNVQVRADVCNPPVGSVVAGKVVRTNRFGVLVSVMQEEDEGVIDGAEQTATRRRHHHASVMDVIVAKQASFKSFVDLAALQPGDMVAMEIVGKKYAVNDDHICAIGKVLARIEDAGGADPVALDAIVTPDDAEARRRRKNVGADAGDETDDGRRRGGADDGSDAEDGDGEADEENVGLDDDSDGGDNEEGDNDDDGDEEDDEEGDEEDDGEGDGDGEDGEAATSDVASTNGSTFRMSSEDFGDDYDGASGGDGEDDDEQGLSDDA